MEKIRREFFETNSSSTHSITLIGGPFNPSKLAVENGKCVIYPAGFGWGGPEEFRESAVKASYCLTYVKERQMRLWREKHWKKEMTKAQTDATYAAQLVEAEVHPHRDEFLKMLTKVVSAEAGIPSTDVLFIPSGGDDSSWGYIDHQSLDSDACGPAFASAATLRNFIFNPSCILVIDHDNH